MLRYFNTVIIALLLQGCVNPTYTKDADNSFRVSDTCARFAGRSVQYGGDIQRCTCLVAADGEQVDLNNASVDYDSGVCKVKLHPEEEVKDEVNVEVVSPDSDEPASTDDYFRLE